MTIAQLSNCTEPLLLLLLHYNVYIVCTRALTLYCYNTTPPLSTPPLSNPPLSNPPLSIPLQKRCCAKFNLKLNLRQNPSDYELPVSLQKNYPKSTLLLSGNKPPQHNPQLTSKNVSVPSHSMNKHASNGMYASFVFDLYHIM